jgi:hypothetical protein
MSNKAIPTGIEIRVENPKPFDFCNVTFLSLKNKSNGSIYYSFHGIKFELLENEEDTFPSPHNLMEGKIEFTIPTNTTDINIKIKTVQKL